MKYYELKSRIHFFAKLFKVFFIESVMYRTSFTGLKQYLLGAVGTLASMIVSGYYEFVFGELI